MDAPAEVTIRDEGSTLVIRAQAPWKQWERLGAAAVAALVVSMVVINLFHIAWWPALALVSGAVTYFAGPGARKAELRMSALECYTKANFSKSLERGRIVLTADILWLEYNEQGFSVSDGIGPSGLYAARRWGSVCLLPLLDGQQTTRVIAAIEQKFSGLAETWRKRSPLGKSVQTLPLEDPKRFV